MGDSYLDSVRIALAPRYRIDREIGHGAYANVFLATRDDSTVALAVKILKPEWSQAVARERFLREIRVTARLHHDNILPLLDSGEVGGFLFFVTPYVRGETLRQKLRRDRQLTLDEILRLTRQISAGLSEAHANGVVHRDVKPENILLEDGRAIMADFGIAKAFTDAGVDTITSTGLGMGTPPYMSPEQASGEQQVDQRSDVYSLACVIYEMLVGETPYTGPTAQVIVAKKLSQPVPSVRAIRETLSQKLDNVLRRGLAKVPADRYATVDEFMAALEPELAAAEREAPRPGSILRRQPRAIAAASVVAVVAVIAAVFLATRPGGGWAGGRPSSVVVVPLHEPTSTEQERALSIALADAVTRELNQWESIRAVPNVSLTGPMFDLGLRGPTLESDADGMRVARQVQVDAMLAVLVRLRGDSAFAEASLVDVARGRSARRPVLAIAATTNLPALVAPIVSDILGLSGDATDPASLRRISTFPDAVVAHLDGLQSLDRGRLGDAEQAFRRAISIDSGFAVAKHHLALTLYLAARLPRRLAAAATEIAQLSTAAASSTRGLSRGDSIRITAFHALQAGEYERARSSYATILEGDPTDVYSLLMRGIVELADPWLIVVGGGSHRPRSNPNVAIRDLREILRLRPPFDLGYDNLSEVYRRVNDAAERGVCLGFALPGNQVLRPWDAGNAEKQEFFCPVIQQDSIVWLPDRAFRSSDKLPLRAGASRFFEQYITLVRRWATYASRDVRPREEMVSALLAQRRRLGLAAPERLTSVADSALRFAESAMALKADTSLDDLARLGNIYLAVGDYVRSLRITSHVLDAYLRQRSVPRLLTANPFLAMGQPARAMQVRSAVPLQRFRPDPESGEMIPFGGAELAIARIQILGANGIAGYPLRRELQDVARLWSESRYNDRQRRALRERVTTDIAAALLLEPDAMAAWDSTVTVTDPLWRSLVNGSDTALARRLLRASMDSATDMWSEPTRAYLQGVVAGRLGDHRMAIARFSRLDSLPLSTESIDTGWGFRSLSLLRRGESWEALGDTAAARRSYEAFRLLWASPDSLGRQLEQVVATRLGRLGRTP